MERTLRCIYTCPVSRVWSMTEYGGFAADNFVEDVVPDLGFELTLPYIMYRNTTDEVLPC